MSFLVWVLALCGCEMKPEVVRNICCYLCASTPPRTDFKPPSWRHWPWHWEVTCTFCSPEPGLANSRHGWNQRSYRLFVPLCFSQSNQNSFHSNISSYRRQREKQCHCPWSQEGGPISEDLFYEGGPFWSGEQPSAPENSLYLSPVAQPQWHRHWMLMPQRGMTILLR